MPVPQENSLFYEQAGKPVHKKLIENGATSQFKIDLTVNDKDREETVGRYLCIAKESAASPAKNSLLAVKNDARLVRRQVYELFAGNCKPEDVLAAGKKEGKRGIFYSHLS